MHAYSGGYSSKSWTLRVTIGVVVVFIALAVLLLARLTEPTQPILAFVCFVLSASLLLMGIGLIYLYTAWRILCTTRWKGVSDFSGTYEEVSADGQPKDSPDTLKITQTIMRNGNEMDIVFVSGDATYKSISAAIIQNRLETKDVELVFTYYSYGSHKGEEREDAHYGTFILKHEENDQLKGCYFTDSKRANYRHLTLQRKR